MPYFTRVSSRPTTTPSSLATEIPSAATSIVEEAAAILGRQPAVAETSQPGSGVDAIAGPAADVPGFAELQRHVSEALAVFLRMYANPTPVAGREKVLLLAPASPEVSAAVPLLACVGAARPGTTATVSIPFVNDGADVAKVALYSSDFIADTGHQISSVQATFSPRAMSLSPRSRGCSTLQVSIPVQTAPGAYSALVQAVGLGQPCAVVTIRIA
jgi:hypothetical protein